MSGSCVTAAAGRPIGPLAAREVRGARLRALILVVLVALAAPLVLAGCGSRAPDERTAAVPAEAATGEVRTAEGAPLHHAEHGRHDAPTSVLLIHGWTCDSSYWDAQLPALGRRYRVVTMDLAGHGRSGRPERAWTIAEYADDVRRVAESLGLERVVLVGHSMGGPIAVEAAAALGPRVLGVIGVDTLSSEVSAQPPDRTQLEGFLAPLRADFAGTVREFVRTSFFTERSDPVLRDRVADHMASAPPEVAIPSVVGLFEWRAEAALARLQVPLVLLNATSSPVDVERLRRLAPAAPEAWVVMLEDVGHFPMLEAPERFDTVLLETLARLESRTAR